MVLTTISFAMKPVTNAPPVSQLPNPSGAKTGAIAPLTFPKYELRCSVTPQGRLSSSHITTDAPRMIVPALRTNSRVFSHMWIITLLSAG